MIGLILSGVIGVSVSQCMAEFPGDRFVERLCNMPDMTMPEVREMKHMQVACDAMKRATEARGETYRWVKLEFADGFTSTCHMKGQNPAELSDGSNGLSRAHR